MNEFKDISNTHYVISRVFGNDNKSSLIEKRIIENKGNNLPLTKRKSMLYNKSGGSIGRKEGL